MEVTGKNQDECMIALHDCNEDVSKAINFLLESTSDMVNGSISLKLRREKENSPLTVLCFNFDYINRRQ